MLPKYVKMISCDLLPEYLTQSERSIYHLSWLSIWVVKNLETILTDFRGEVGPPWTGHNSVTQQTHGGKHTKSPLTPRSDLETPDGFICMSLCCGRKLAHLKETNTGKGREHANITQRGHSRLKSRGERETCSILIHAVRWACSSLHHHAAPDVIIRIKQIILPINNK